MTAWRGDELATIASTAEVELAPARPDGSLGKPVTVWVVRAGDDLYVRSWRGPGGGWFRRARETRAGRLRAGSLVRHVRLVEAEAEAGDAVDTAYREKYHRFADTYLPSMVRPDARATTLRLVPRAEGAR